MRKQTLHLFIAVAFAMLSLSAVSVRAQDCGDRRPTPQEHRVYDSVHKDYHVERRLGSAVSLLP